jgi:capsule polysaccharide export protein KpsE/RkpR
LLWSNRRFLRNVTLASLVFGTAVAFLLPKEYQSTLQLMPPDSQSASGAAAILTALTSKAADGLGAMAGDILGGGKTSGALFVGILSSRTIQDRLVQRFDLKRVYRDRLNEDAWRDLANNTVVSEDHKSGIITISVVDKDPARAAAIGQAYVEELDRLVSELSVSSAHRERVFLEDRLKVVKQRLDEASKKFSEFASQNSAINIPEQGKAMVEAAATLQGELIAAESQLKGMQEIYTSSNARVRSLSARVAELRRQLDALGGDANASSQQPASSKGSLYPSIRELPILGVTYADLLRTTRIQEAVYEALTQQYELARVQEAKEMPSVKVLDAANVPERKKFPPRGLVIFWCALIGLAAASGWVIVEIRWKQLDSHNAGKVLAQEVFHTVNASMPWAPPNGSRVQAITHRVWTRLVRRAPETWE